MVNPSATRVIKHLQRAMDLLETRSARLHFGSHECYVCKKKTDIADGMCEQCRYMLVKPQVVSLVVKPDEQCNYLKTNQSVYYLPYPGADKTYFVFEKIFEAGYSDFSKWPRCPSYRWTRTDFSDDEREELRGSLFYEFCGPGRTYNFKGNISKTHDVYFSIEDFLRRPTLVPEDYRNVVISVLVYVPSEETKAKKREDDESYGAVHFFIRSWMNKERRHELGLRGSLSLPLHAWSGTMVIQVTGDPTIEMESSPAIFNDYGGRSMYQIILDDVEAHPEVYGTDAYRNRRADDSSSDYKILNSVEGLSFPRGRFIRFQESNFRRRFYLWYIMEELSKLILKHHADRLKNEEQYKKLIEKMIAGGYNEAVSIAEKRIVQN